MSITVFAVPPQRVARIDAQGRPGRDAIGYGPLGEPLAEGSPVDDHVHYRRAERRGECTIGAPGPVLVAALAEQARLAALRDNAATLPALSDTLAGLAAAHPLASPATQPTTSPADSNDEPAALNKPAREV